MTDFCAIEDAVAELGPPAFTLWIRIAATIDFRAKFKSRGELARAFDLPVRTSNRHLRELRNKGYLRLVQLNGGHGTQIILHKRPMIQTPHSFGVF